MMYLQAYAYIYPSCLTDLTLDNNGQMKKHFAKLLKLKDRLPPSLSAGNIQHFVSFLTILQENPQRRLSATKLLNHPFLVSVSELTSLPDAMY